MNLEEKLVALRKEKGLSQLKLAEMMNVSRQAISRWEVGTAVPSIDNLKSLGRLYDVSLEYLLHDDAPEPDRATKSTKDPTEHQKRKNYMVYMFLIVIGILVVVMCIMACLTKDKEPVPMNDIEGREIETVSEFEFGW